MGGWWWVEGGWDVFGREAHPKVNDDLSQSWYAAPALVFFECMADGFVESWVHCV